MRRLAVMAHYDPTGGLGPHVRRQVEALAAWFDDVVVVSTADLRAADRDWLEQRVRLVERANEGYDFYSYKVGLDSVDLAGYDEVAVCNDTYVLARDYASIFAAMTDVAADFWGLTSSNERHQHVQSFFVVFRRTALDTPVFADFWDGMRVLTDRKLLIRRYEIGMSRRFHGAGLRSAAYFVPTPADVRVADRRQLWQILLNRGPTLRPTRLRNYARAVRQHRYNPAAALADRVLDGARLPMVKIATLRYDYYGLDGERLLGLCEQALPEPFADVRAYLDATAPAYAGREGAFARPVPWWLRPFRRAVVYRRP